MTYADLRQHEVCGFDGTLAKPIYPHTYRHVCRGGDVSTALSPIAADAQSEERSARLPSPEPKEDRAALTAEMLRALPPTVIQARNMVSQSGFPTDFAARGRAPNPRAHAPPRGERPRTHPHPPTPPTHHPTRARARASSLSARWVRR